MYHAPLISTPIVYQSYNNTQPTIWECVMKAWRKKEYQQTIYQLLNFLGVQYQESDKIHQIPHGSIIIYLEIDEEKLKISAPFISISGGMQLPILRQILLINHEPLQLTRVILNDNHLDFYFESMLDHCDPYKIFDVLKEICIHADLYDDNFIRKYKASRIVTPQIKFHSESTQLKCIQEFRKILEETESTLQMLLQDRAHEYIWDNLLIMLLKIDFIISPNGHIKSDIEKGIVEMHSHLELSEKINIGKRLLQNFKSLTDNQIREDLYTIQTFVPLKELISHESFKNQLQQIVLQVQREFQKKEYLAAYFTTLYQILFITYQYDLDEECMPFVLQILQELNGDIQQSKIQKIIQLLKMDIEMIPKALIELPQNEGVHIEYITQD